MTSFYTDKGRSICAPTRKVKPMNKLFQIFVDFVDFVAKLLMIAAVIGFFTITYLFIQSMAIVFGGF